MEKTADNSIGNVTGSNSVNVFLGLGLPWVMAAIYHTSKVSRPRMCQPRMRQRRMRQRRMRQLLPCCAKDTSHDL